MDKQLTVKQYISKNMLFTIPHYQRGYVWGKGNKSDNQASYIIESIKKGIGEPDSMFLQGITVSEDVTNGQIVIIDGQQRTTF